MQTAFSGQVQPSDANFLVVVALFFAQPHIDLGDECGAGKEKGLVTTMGNNGVVKEKPRANNTLAKGCRGLVFCHFGFGVLCSYQCSC